MLFDLGLEEPSAKWGVTVEDKEIRLWSTGQTWLLFNCDKATIGDRYGAPMFALHRGDRHAALVKGVGKLKKDAILFVHRAVAFEQDENEVTLKSTTAPKPKATS